MSMQAFAVNTRYDARRLVTMKLLANVTRLFLLYERSRVFSLLAVVLLLAHISYFETH